MISPSWNLVKRGMFWVQKTHLIFPVLSWSSTLQTSPSLPLRVLNDLLLEIDMTLPATVTSLLPSSSLSIDLAEYSGLSEIASTFSSWSCASLTTMSAKVASPINEMSAFSFLKTFIRSKNSSSVSLSLTLS